MALNRRELMAAAVGAAGVACLPVSQAAASSTSTTYVTRFWHFDDVREAWCGEPMDTEGDPSWFRFRTKDGEVVKVSKNTYYKYLVKELFPQHFGNSEMFFTDIMDEF